MILAGFSYLTVRRDGIYVRATAPVAFANYHDLIDHPVTVRGHFGDHAYRCKRVLHPASGPIRVGDMIDLILNVSPC